MRRISKYLLAGIVITALLWLGGLGNGLAAIGTSTPTPTQTPTRTPTRPVNLVSVLTRQFFFSPGGGLNKISPDDCITSEDTADTPPAIRFYGRADYDVQQGFVCLINISLEDRFEIELTAPDGTKYVQEIDPTGNTDNGYFGFDYAADENGVRAGMVTLWLSPDVQPGDWQINYLSQNEFITHDESLNWPPDIFTLYVPRKNANPLALPAEPLALGATHLYQNYKLKPGQTINLAGANLPARKTIPLGLYQIAGSEELRLVQAIPATTDGNGEFRTSFKTDKNLPQGTYYLGAILNQRAKQIYDSGPGIGITMESCPGVMDSYLMIGDKVKIDPGFTEENTLRIKPGLGNRKSGQLGAAQTGVILEGPACVDERLWWKLRTSKGADGWIVEAFDFNRFVVRIK